MPKHYSYSNQTGSDYSYDHIVKPCLMDLWFMHGRLNSIGKLYRVQWPLQNRKVWSTFTVRTTDYPEDYDKDEIPLVEIALREIRDSILAGTHVPSNRIVVHAYVTERGDRGKVLDYAIIKADILARIMYKMPPYNGIHTWLQRHPVEKV